MKFKSPMTSLIVLQILQWILFVLATYIQKLSRCVMTTRTRYRTIVSDELCIESPDMWEGKKLMEKEELDSAMSHSRVICAKDSKILFNLICYN